MSETLRDMEEYLASHVPTTAPLELSADTRLRRDLGLDSLRLVQVIIGMEERFGVMFDDADLSPSSLRTVGDLMALLDKARAGG